MPSLDRKAQADLERRLARLEAENEKLRKEMFSHASKPASKKLSSKATVSLQGAPDESDVFLQVRKSLEEGLAQMAKVERGRRAELEEKVKELKEKQREVAEMRKSGEEVMRQAEELKSLVAGGKERKKTLAKAPSFMDKKADAGAKGPPGPKKADSPRRKSPKRSSSPRKESAPPPSIPVPTTRAAQLREARREAEKAAQGEAELAGSSDPKKPWTFMGPRPKDPASVQRVDRQRGAGSDANDVAPRKSRDFDRMVTANTSVNLKITEGKPLDWSALMGTNERKALVKSGALRKDDATYEEVRGIAR